MRRGQGAGDSAKAPGPADRRAPRLGPDEHITGYFTRRGRFRNINPAKPRPMPGLVRMLGIIGWAVVMEESFRRARARLRGQPRG